jgi:CheY-like chemotaxis protein
MVRKVLFVDDDQIMLLAIEKRFVAFSDSFSMIMAHDGFDAVQKLRENSVSLIILDLKMPRMDGMSLLTHAREKFPDIPVIIVSGYRTDEMYKLAKAKGVIAYISKPFQVDDLGKIIMSTLHKESDGGIMHNVSPTVFLQLMEMESKTCTIRILDKVSQKGGILYFRDGNLLDARVGEIKGINAAYRVFTWEEVTLFIQNECTPRENKINSQLQPIIMKAVGMKDESDESLIVAEKEENDPDSSIINDDLDDLDLPEDFLESAFKEGPDYVQTSNQAIKEKAISKPREEKAASRSHTDIITDLLRQKVGEKCGLEDVYQDETMGNVVEFLTDLGALFDFGKLKVGYIDNGRATDTIVMPGQPTTILKVNPKGPRDKIIQVLSDFT